jgi:hypothetical protein
MGVIDAGLAAIGLSSDPPASSSKGQSGKRSVPSRGGYGQPYPSASSGSSYGTQPHRDVPSGSSYGSGSSNQSVPKSMSSSMHGQASLQSRAAPHEPPPPYGIEEEGHRSETTGVADSGW